MSYLQEHFNKYAVKRMQFKQRGQYYHNLLEKFLRFIIPTKQSVLEVGCGIGHTLAALEPKIGFGIDLSEEMIKEAKKTHPNLEFHFQFGRIWFQI